MSRIGNLPITIPEGVEVNLSKTELSVKGAKGELKRVFSDQIKIQIEDKTITVSRDNDEKSVRALHGLTRSLIQNMIDGVSQGFKKQLEVNGVGFKVAASGNKLNMSLGFSHPTEYIVPENVSVSVDGNVITLEGIDKQSVGQVAAEIRALKKPEPYKGKGIQYVGEQIIRKVGKAAGGGEAA